MVSSDCVFETGLLAIASSSLFVSLKPIVIDEDISGAAFGASFSVSGFTAIFGADF